MSIQTPISTTPQGAITPSKVYEDELIDWDVTAQVPQFKPLGTLKVTLKYVGEIQPSPITDTWD